MRVWLLAVASLACVIAVSSALAGHEAVPFKVTSTLDGKRVLPHRILWLAFPKLPATPLAGVVFLIDGKVRWIEHNPPFTYGGDESRFDDGAYLVTSWLAPGRHRFTVRATATDGRKATDTVVARVLPAPLPPAELADTRWERNVTQSEAGDAPPGTWKILIDKVGWGIIDPLDGGNLVDIAYLSPGLLEARGGIFTRPDGTKPEQGNGWCGDTNQPVRYRWSVDSDTLTLSLSGPRRCDGQSGVWGGSWTRVP
jgi:hypothetical protein